MKRKLLTGLVLAACITLGLAGWAQAQTTGGTIGVEVDCYGNPETVTIINATGGSFEVIAVGSLDDPRPGEPYAVNTTLAAGEAVTYQAGTAAPEGAATTLTRQFIFDNEASQEGALVLTSLGNMTVLCSVGASVFEVGEAATPTATAPAATPVATATESPAPATATAVAPPPSAVSVTPPNTGDGGLAGSNYKVPVSGTAFLLLALVVGAARRKQIAGQ